MRCATRFLFIFLMSTLFICPAHAGTHALFGDHLYGAARRDLEKLPGIKKGEGAFAETLLLEGVPFAQTEWTARFVFSDDTLTRVGLVTPYSQERADAVTTYLRKEGYEMLAILIGERELDFVAMLKVAGVKGLEHAMRELHAGGPYERTTHAWFFTRPISTRIKQTAKNLKEFLMTAPAETREVEITVLHPTQENQDAMLLVDFSFPILDAQK